jgi:hypothetical protein
VPTPLIVHQHLTASLAIDHNATMTPNDLSVNLNLPAQRTIRAFGQVRFTDDELDPKASFQVGLYVNGVRRALSEGFLYHSATVPQGLTVQVRRAFTLAAGAHTVQLRLWAARPANETGTYGATATGHATEDDISYINLEVF